MQLQQNVKLYTTVLLAQNAEMVEMVTTYSFHIIVAAINQDEVHLTNIQ
jgi:hypothetical protein